MKRIHGQGVGFFLAAVLICFLVWANVSKLDVGVRANGTVIAQSRAQIIQAPDGGVIQELFVNEGDVVRKGQILAQLEENRAAASVGELKIKLASLEIAKRRAEAQSQNKTPDFSDFSDELSNIVQAEQSLFDASNAALEENLHKAEQSLAIANNELEAVQRLRKTRSIGQLDLNTSEDKVIRLEGEIERILSEYRIDAHRERAKIEGEVASLEYKLQGQDVNLQYTKITSPVDGIVSQLNVNTLGGVLRPGETLMQISPTNGEYIVEAKVRPADIGQLSLGLPASIKLSSYDYTIYGALQGKVNYVSPDTIIEKSANDENVPFYRTHVRVDLNDQTNPRIDPNEALKPGVTTTVDIRVGKQTVMQFLSKPILRAYGGAATQR